MGLGAQALMWGLVWLCVSSCHSVPTQHCDTGKAKLDIDLPPPDVFLCPTPRPVSPSLKLLEVSTKYSPQPAEHVCMDLPITYNNTIPNSGAHRPIGAQYGEYLYCPPQRWINNLKDGATVLLFHPCASVDARRSLAAVAHSCLSHFILTAHPQLSKHRPFALVSWGHTLEMSHITAAGVCEWLRATSSKFNRTTANESRNYNLYLTTASPVDRRLDISSLKECCVKALSAYEATARARQGRSVLQPAKEEMEKIETRQLETDLLNATQTLNNIEGKDLSSKAPHGHVTAPVHFEKHVGVDVTMAKPHDSRTGVKSLKKSMKRIKTDVVELSAGGGCSSPGHCRAPDVDNAVIGGPLAGHMMTVQRTDEAVWAAAALGFLLVLLTLSVLHTRLYRNCRPPSSLYWRESQQDYESVADIIRRRLRMVGRRKRKASQSRRKECPLLVDSSTDDD